MKPGRGRKRKPLELIKLQGNPGKRAIPKDTPQPDKLYNIPEAPGTLDRVGKETWNYLAPKLIKCGIMTEIDIYTLENCCVALSIIRKAEKELLKKPLVFQTKDGEGNLKAVHKTPFMGIWRDALGEFDSNGAKLGLSPSDRIKLRTEKTEEKSPLMEFLKQGHG